MKVQYVDLIAQHKQIKKELLKECDKVLSHGNFILGKEVEFLEEAFARYCGSKYALGVGNGTDALRLSMKVLGVGVGDEVITASNSFLASASSIAEVGAIPVFADVGSDMNIDPIDLERKITKRTKAIMPVHLTGRVAQMDAILKIARKHKLPVIEDAAQAIGAEYKNKRAGSLGTLACFSLHPLKTLNACGDGGMITTSDKNLYERLKQLRNIGLKNRVESDIWGCNSRLDSLQAAFVLVKMKYLDAWIATRRKNAEYYRKNLQDIVLCPVERSNEKCAYHLFVIQADRRDQLQAFLLKNGIDTKIHYPIPIHYQKCASGLKQKRGSLVQTEYQSNRILSLPIHQYLTQKHLAYVVQKIKEFYQK